LWNGSAWEDFYLSSRTYDSNNNVTYVIGQNWNGSEWEDANQYSYSYDANNNQLSIIGQDWNSNQWENSFQTTYTYDANNNQTNRLEQLWNASVWENDYQSTHTYDNNNNETSGLFQFWNGNTWVKEWQYAYTFDANNFYVTDTYKSWNNDGNAIYYADSTLYFYHTVLGLEELVDRDNRITIYPNPGNGMITISLNTPINSIEIYNLAGELVTSIHPSRHQTSYKIDLTNNAKGIYFAKINTGNTVYTRKIIIQ
jgi:hypothetical protein